MTSRRATLQDFSLTGLVGSMAVLVLVAIALPGRRERAPTADLVAMAAHFERLVAALDAHVVDTGRWPFDVTLEGAVEPSSIVGLVRNDVGLRGWAGPYLESIDGAGGATPASLGLSDPWGRAYRLHVFPTVGDGIALVLWSGGPNGAVETDARGLRSGRARGDDLVLRAVRTR